MPYLLSYYLNVPYVLSVLTLLCITTYYTTKHERIRRNTALQIVNDNNLLQLILDQLPGYVYDPQMQRCEWLNLFLVGIWPGLSEAVCTQVKSVVEPSLNQQKTGIIKSLIFNKLSLGTC